MFKNLSKKKVIGIILGIFVLFSLATNGNESNENNETGAVITDTQETTKETQSNTELLEQTENETSTIVSEEQTEEVQTVEQEQSASYNSDSIEYNGNTYKIIEVDGGNQSGNRQSNVAVDVGFGERVYWALTNEYGQLIHVIADEVVLQDDNTEPVNSDGRYYNDEAKVPGTERDDLDEGHIIADSLGGVSNAYNITPQDSTLNRYGDQAYMEKVIRDAGGCENFVATITYSDTTSQIPSHYHYEYILKGENIVDDFDNVNPDEVNATIETQSETKSTESADNSNVEDVSKIDTNGNGKVTIAEAKDAGYSMPIYSNHWLYKYMDDRDHDGMVGE